MYETNTRKIVQRLLRDGWVSAGGAKHDKFKHPDKKGRIILPRRKTQSPGVAKDIAKQAGWE